MEQKRFAAGSEYWKKQEQHSSFSRDHSGHEHSGHEHEHQRHSFIPRGHLRPEARDRPEGSVRATRASLLGVYAG